MPLQGGTSRAVISANIEEMLHKWKQTGKIGNSAPRTMKEARAQAAAIAYDKARESAKKSKNKTRHVRAWVSQLEKS